MTSKKTQPKRAAKLSPRTTELLSIARKIEELSEQLTDVALKLHAAAKLNDAAHAFLVQIERTGED